MSVEKRNGYWCFRTRIEKNNSFSNKRIGKYKTKKEAQIAELRYKANIDNIANTSVTLNEVLELYIKDKRTSVKEVTIYDINKKYRLHIEPTFGTTTMNKLNLLNIKAWQNNLFDKGYKNSQLRNIQILFNSIIKYAIKHDIINKNPFDKLKYITRIESKDEMQFFTYEQYLIFEKYIPDITFYKLALITLYYTGLRVGELQALTWNDYKDNNLFIHSTFDNKLKKVSNTTKTTVNRYVLLTDNIIELLDNLKFEFSQYKDFDNTKFIFGYYDPISHKSLTNYKNYAISAANEDNHKLPKIRIHDLRHSHVSLLKNNGFSSFEIAKRVGNTEREINETYAHLFNEKQIEMKDKLNNIINKNK